MKSYQQWIYILGIPLFAIGGIILYFPSVAIQIFKLHWLSLLTLLIMLCSPRRRNLRLASAESEPPRYTRASWLLQIFLLQLSFFAVFLGICVGCGVSAPVNTTVHTGLFAQTMQKTLISQGLFPWGFYAIIAILMGKYAYCRREDAYLATTLGPLASNTLLKISINFSARVLTLTAYGVTICLLSLLWASMGSVYPIITGFYLTTLLLTVILLLLSFTRLFRRNLTKGFDSNIPIAPSLFLLSIIFAAVIWLLNGFLAPWTHVQMAAPTILGHWLNYNWKDLWVIFANSFWILWAPLTGITLARLSRGYRIKEIIAGILIFPLIAALVLYFTRNIQWDIPPIYAGLIAAGGLVILFVFTLGKKSIPSFILSYLPRQDHYKFRSYRRTLVRLAQCAVGFLFIYLPGGIYVTNFLVFTFALCAIAITIVMITISVSV